MYAIDKVSYRVSGRKLLDGISIDLPRGAFVTVVGPNGAGKSTLIKVIAGGLRPTGGNVSLDGQDITRLGAASLSAIRAVLMQSSTVSFAYTVRQVVEMGLPGKTHRPPQQLVDEALSDVGLLAMHNRRCPTLSGGEQQRVHLARVLVQIRATDGPPGFLLLDEPTTGLDLSYQTLVLDLARRHVSDGGGTLAVLHDLNLASCYADRIVAMKEGQIYADGHPEEVITNRLLRDLYDVSLSVNTVPDSVFVLPGTDSQHLA